VEWFRLWHDFFDDPKLRRLTKAQKFDVLAMLRLASGNTMRGQIDLCDEDIADHLQITDEEFAILVEFLVRKEIAARNEAGRLYFIHWMKRQPKTDNVAARVAESRAKKKDEDPCNVTSGESNVTVTNSVTTRTEQNREEQNRNTITRPSASRGTRLEKPFELPDEWKEFAERERPHLDAIIEGQKFADYWHSTPGTKGLKSDWYAVWRNYVRSDLYGRGQIASKRGQQPAEEPKIIFTRRPERPGPRALTEPVA